MFLAKKGLFGTFGQIFQKYGLNQNMRELFLQFCLFVIFKQS